MKRHQNHGLRKRCDCARRSWPKCPHGWWFNFKPTGGPAYRISLDKHLGRHLDRKADAEDAAAAIRAAIKAGRFGQPVVREEMTVRMLADTYLDRYVKVQRASTEQAYKWGLGTICATTLPRPTGGCAPFGEWRVNDVVTDTIERFREVRRKQGTGVVGVNRHLGMLRALWNWALRTGYVEKSPFKRGTEAVVRLSQEPSRARRLQPEEEAPLLAACNPHLRAIVEAALETGCRKGELLSLQWSQVEGMTLRGTQICWMPRAVLVLTAVKTKTKRDRRIPISSRLKGLLEMRRFDPAGNPHGLDAYVFGNAIGQRVGSIKRAWTAAVLRSHGCTPEYTSTANLTPASRAAMAEIDLHLHDLRRECGSRWLEGGVPLHTVRDWLGHTNISQTSTYLAGTQQTQHDAMRLFEERTALVQRSATEVETAGRKRPSTANQHEETPNETTIGRELTIM